MTIYRAKKEGPFDKGCELDLIEDYRREGSKSGIFLGLREGKIIQSYLAFAEVEIEHDEEEYE